MAPRRRRKISLLPPFFSSLVATLVAILGIATLSFLVWHAWPTLSAHWRSRPDAATASKKHRDAQREAPVSEEKPADVLARLKQENESLRAENARLHDLLNRTSEALSLKNAELDEMKLRKLIQEKLRSGQP